MAQGEICKNLEWQANLDADEYTWKIVIFRWIAKKETNKIQDELKMGKKLCILFLSVQVWKNIQVLLNCANVKDLLRERV